MNREKQMTADAHRLMRPGGAAQGCHPARPHRSIAKRDENRGSAKNKAGPYEGSSRMKGNFHVRFLGGCGRATARAYPAWPLGGFGVATGWPPSGFGVASG